MPHVALEGGERHAAAEDAVCCLRLRDVAQLGPGPVAVHIADGLRREPGVVKGHPHAALHAGGVGRGDVHGIGVRGGAGDFGKGNRAARHGVIPVLDEERPRALPDDYAVAAPVKWPRRFGRVGPGARLEQRVEHPGGERRELLGAAADHRVLAPEQYGVAPVAERLRSGGTGN